MYREYFCPQKICFRQQDITNKARKRIFELHPNYKGLR